MKKGELGRRPKRGEGLLEEGKRNKFLTIFPMSILDTLQKDSIEAMKSGKKEDLEILKMAITSIKNAQIQKGREEELTEEEEAKVLSSEVKKLKDSVFQYKAAGRDDLADREQSQLEVMLKYLPAQMDRSEIEDIVKEVISEVGATGKGQMGMVMGTAMKRLSGEVDGNEVKEIVMELLP
ncbi:MAG: GatB/YqeY domain-containing protein [bacterium]